MAAASESMALMPYFNFMVITLFIAILLKPGIVSLRENHHFEHDFTNEPMQAYLYSLSTS